MNDYFICFRVDKDKSGQISANELSGALSNGKWLVYVQPCDCTSCPNVAQ